MVHKCTTFDRRRSLPNPWHAPRPLTLAGWIFPGFYFEWLARNVRRICTRLRSPVERAVRPSGPFSFASDNSTASGFQAGNQMNLINCKATSLLIIFELFCFWLSLSKKVIVETLFSSAALSRISCRAVTQLHRLLLLLLLLPSSATTSQFPPDTPTARRLQPWPPLGFLPLHLLLLWAAPVIWHSWEVTLAQATLSKYVFCQRH